MINTAVMGYGTVGSGVVEIINKKGSSLSEKNFPFELCVKHILDLRNFDGDENEAKFTKSFEDILEDDSVKIVVETMGGIEPAFSFCSRLLAAGKHVVTSNKELVAEKGQELLKLARENNRNFLFEASVGGGIPLIRPLTSCLAANEIVSLNGILNGTTNFILTKMISDNMSFETALKTAQEKGYAEKDPSADIEGHDACRKICILSALCFGHHVYPKDVHCEGITGITLEDVAYAAGAGAVIKLIATARRLENGQLYILTAPALVDGSSQLGNVNDVFNAISVCGDFVGETVFYGKGAGKLPTASAVVADMLDCACDLNSRRPIGWGKPKPELIADYKSVKNNYYLRLAVHDSFRALPAVKAAFGEIKLLARSGASSRELAFLTDEFTEREVREKLSGLGGVKLKSLIRTAKC